MLPHTYTQKKRLHQAGDRRNQMNTLETVRCQVSGHSTRIWTESKWNWFIFTHRQNPAQSGASQNRWTVAKSKSISVTLQPYLCVYIRTTPLKEKKSIAQRSSEPRLRFVELFLDFPAVFVEWCCQANKYRVRESNLELMTYSLTCKNNIPFLGICCLMCFFIQLNFIKPERMSICVGELHFCQFEHVNLNLWRISREW